MKILLPLGLLNTHAEADLAIENGFAAAFEESNKGFIRV